MIQLTVLNNIVRTLEEGKQIITARNVKTKIWVKKHDIHSVSELVKNENNMYKTRCEANIEHLGSIIINIPPLKLVERLKETKLIIKGFNKCS